MSAVVAPGVEAMGAAATRRWRAGEHVPLGSVLSEMLSPMRVLAVGDGAAECAALMLDRGARPTTFVGIDPCAASVARVAAHFGDPSTAAALALHQARLLGDPPEVPHFTRVPELVRSLCGPGFDLIVVESPGSGATLHLLLAQLVPLLDVDGVLCATGLERCADAVDVMGRVAREVSGPTVLWQPGEGVPAAALLQTRMPRHNHEASEVLCAPLLAADEAVAAARTAGDHVAVCGALRRWLARRLVWSTRDLLLPLGELPPALSVLDVVEQCARGEGGVWSYGAAVTLAMLYRACGYPATVYQHGMRDLYWHMVTLVQVPDGRILVEDAFFDAELRRDGRPITWPEGLEVAHAGCADTLELVSGLGEARPHLYSRASLPSAEADGFLTPAERTALEAAMAGCQRVVGEPRAALSQPITVGLEAFTRIPVHARALAQVRRLTGITHPLALLGLPCGALPLSGDRRLDGEIVRVLETWERLARALEPAAAVGA
jgi:hypothetical protein